jgi:hypothetical protein
MDEVPEWMIRNDVYRNAPGGICKRIHRDDDEGEVMINYVNISLERTRRNKKQLTNTSLYLEYGYYHLVANGAQIIAYPNPEATS